MNRQWIFWILIVTLFFLFVFAIKAILLPFVIGILVAYFLDPAADKLEDWGLSRALATVIITLLFFTGITLTLVLLFPLLYNQFSGLISILPDYIAQWQDLFKSKLHQAMGHLNGEQLQSAQEAVSNASKDIMSALAKFVTGLLKSGFAIVNLLSLIVITPVVSFYLLRDWDRIVEQIKGLLPRQHAELITQQVQIIDSTLSGFIRGTVNVMIVLGTFYSIALSLIGLDFAVIIGIIGGIMIIIPYLGTVISGLAAVGMAYLQFESIENVLGVLAIFIAGQMLEGYALTPKLVGDRVGLHPLWLIFGMLAGAALFGFVGIFLAVPVTAVIGVLVRLAIRVYRESDYYDGSEPTKKKAKTT